MSSPHVPRTSTALPLHDASRDLTQARDSTPGFRSHPGPMPTFRPRENGYPSTSTPSGASYLPPNPSISTPPPIHFRSTTIAPSPPAQNQELPPHHDAFLTPEAPHHEDKGSHSPVGSLRISTDFSRSPVTPIRRESFNSNGYFSGRSNMSLSHKASAGSLRPISRTPSLKTALANSIGSASGTSSVVPSPIITAMGDVTPLPSPLMSGDSPGPWKRLSAGSASPPQSRLRHVGEGSVLITTAGESIDAALAYAPKRKLYSRLEPGENPPPQTTNGHQEKQHTRNRSVSDYVPDPMGIPKRQITVSGSHVKIDTAVEEKLEPHIRRELNFAQSRGLAPSVAEPPTPPPSESSRDSADGSSKPKSQRYEYFEARGRQDRKRRRWRAIRQLGQGTFSRVMMATSQIEPEDDTPQTDSGLLTPQSDLTLDRKTLVAVKVCEHGPKGGASEERIEMSLKRELEIMQSIRHPSLVDLKAWSIEPTRAILVLSYCPGGDLFDVATSHRDVLQPALLRRIFSEIVGAVSYLHERRIVHRDIKLESKLCAFSRLDLTLTLQRRSCQLERFGAG